MKSQLSHPIRAVTQVGQWVIGRVLSPNPPASRSELRGPKIAIIGAGITGVTVAAHCVGHGFDVTIFEAGDENRLGGIWSVCVPISTRQKPSFSPSQGPPKLTRCAY
jgi:hypothetical protein